MSVVLAALLAGLFIVLGLLVSVQGDMRDAEDRRSESVRLADDLRHSSDDLTRMARLYVSTGEPRYRDWFEEIVAIRNGSAPRPDRYDLVYWDLVGPDNVRPRGAGEPKALEDLMIAAGFTVEEFILLREAEARSNTLILIEDVAMDTVEGRFDDDTDRPVVDGVPDIKMARELMFGDEYMAHKKAIMEPINEFVTMIDLRTMREVDALNDRGQRYGWIALIISAMAISITWVAVTVVRRRVLAPLTILEASTAAISSGDFSKPVEYASDDEFGDLVGAFNEMQRHLGETMGELDEKRHALEDEVLARTLELRHTVGSLERSNRDLERMALVTAHDLSEPLRKIVIFGERLADSARDDLDDRSRNYLDRMTSATVRMQALIDGLLAFSRVATRAEPFVWVDLSGIARGVASDLEMMISDTGAVVEIGDLPSVWGEPTLLRQLIQNLMSNGIKFHAPDSAPWVRISSDEASGHDNGQAIALCQFVVEDHGIGIGPDDVESVFDLFTHLHDRETYPGSGIGLSICRRIVEHHGGTITIEANTPTGTRIAVTLPVDGRGLFR